MKSVIEVYSDMAKANPPWKADEERQFIQSCCTRTGKWKSKAMKDKFVTEAVKRNLNLVFKLFNQYSFKKDSEDIFQRAVVAMAEALKKYDPSSKNKISTWIQQPIVWAIKQSQNTYYKGNDIHEQMMALNHRFNLHLKVVSLTTPAKKDDDGDNTVTWENFISSENVDSDYMNRRGLKTVYEECKESDIKSGVADMMVELPRFLNKKELLVIKYFLKGFNMVEISMKMKLSRMRISQISANAFGKIRRSRVGKRLKGLLA